MLELNNTISPLDVHYSRIINSATWKCHILSIVRSPVEISINISLLQMNNEIHSFQLSLYGTSSVATFKMLNHSIANVYSRQSYTCNITHFG